MSGSAPAQQRFIDAHAPLLAAVQDLDKDELICLLMEAQLKVDTLTVRAEAAEEELEEVEEEKESWIDRVEKQKDEIKDLIDNESKCQDMWDGLLERLAEGEEFVTPGDDLILCYDETLARAKKFGFKNT
tara:strand:- start:1148 stop:1537 length:390 start_codon:yes stop_codon:yes gene_type:complete